MFWTVGRDIASGPRAADKLAPLAVHTDHKAFYATQNGSNTFTSVLPGETNFATCRTSSFWTFTPGFHEVFEGQNGRNASKVDITVTPDTHAAGASAMAV